MYNKGLLFYNSGMINKKDFRILYMGTPKMSADILVFLIKGGYNVVGVIAQEDKPQGRKGLLEKVPTKVVAEQYNIPVYQPHRIRKEYEFVKDINPDLILTMAYGQIIPQGLLDIPRLGCLNIHGSLLPKYRGAAPIQRAIINGETITGVTLMEMIDKMDAGKMYAKEQCEISLDDNYTSLCEKIVQCGKNVIKKNLPSYLEGNLKGMEQDESEVTFADKINPEDEKIDLELTKDNVINYIRGLSETPGAYVLLKEEKFKIFKAHVYSNSTVNPVGTLTIAKRTILQLIDGEIELDSVQMSGKKKMDGKSFANGAKQYNGEIVK